MVDGDDGDICAAKTVQESSGCRLVGGMEDFKTDNLAGVLSCLSLSIVEVCRDGDGSMVELLIIEELLSSFLHLRQNLRGQLLREENLPLSTVVDIDSSLAIQL